MADYARRMRGLGVELVGGCCGSTPAHMAAMAAALAEYEPGSAPICRRHTMHQWSTMVLNRGSA